MTAVDSRSFRRALRELPKAIKATTDAINEKSARGMANHIKRIAPKRTGNLRSTVQVIDEGNGDFSAVFGGPKTQRTIGKRTYDRQVEIGAGRSTTGAKKQAGGSRLVWDYARLIEFGSRQVKKDPSYVPARRRAARLHGRRLRSAVTKAAKALSA